MSLALFRGVPKNLIKDPLLVARRVAFWKVGGHVKMLTAAISDIHNLTKRQYEPCDL